MENWGELMAFKGLITTLPCARLPVMGGVTHQDSPVEMSTHNTQVPITDFLGCTRQASRAFICAEQLFYTVQLKRHTCSFADCSILKQETRNTG